MRISNPGDIVPNIYGCTVTISGDVINSHNDVITNGSSYHTVEKSTDDDDDIIFVSGYVIFLLTAPPPSKAIFRNIFKNTTDLDNLCLGLSIPDDKRDVDSAVEYHARSTDPVKMRMMIFCLDYIGDTALAESVMDYAEPPAGMTVPVQWRALHSQSTALPLVTFTPSTLCVLPMR